MVKSNKNTRKIYMDHAAGAPWGASNPGTIHEFGMKEKNKLENSRAVIAKILNARSAEIVFTSGSTESNNLAILGLTQNFKKPHIVTINIEHPSVLEVLKHLEETKKAEVTYVKVEKNGIVDVKKIKKALKPNTVLVSVMYANNEIGTIQPIAEIAKEIRHFNKINLTRIFFHTDATQAVNYLPINVLKLGVDMMSFNSAKIYGPKGIGVLYIKKNTPIKKIMFGGDQEMGLRPGTENVATAVDFASALQYNEKIKEKEEKRLTKLRDYFIALLLLLKEAIPVINGDLENRLPNNINITFPKIPSDLLVVELSAKGIMVSSKSACHSSGKKDSYVINALRCGADSEIGGLRFSLGRDTTKKDIDYTIKTLSQILNKLEKWYN